MEKTYPVRYWVDYPEKSSRGVLLLRTFLGWLILLPHFFLLMLLNIPLALVLFIAWWAILFTGKWPEGMFRFVVKVMRYAQWVQGYILMLTDRYPPFFGAAEPGADYPVHLEVDYPAKSSRLILLLRTLFWEYYVGIPHGFCLVFLAIVQVFVLFIAWWAILFAGKFPKGLFHFVEGVNRWSLRVSAYINMLTDAYPPFSLA
jgi:hypothetical protein